MEASTGRTGFFKNILVRVLLFGVIIILFRFAYFVTLAGESCNHGDFCFFSFPNNFSLLITGAGPAASAGNHVTKSTTSNELSPQDKYTNKDWIESVRFYSSVFQDLIADGYLSPESKSLCVESGDGQDVFALREIGVKDSIGVSKKSLRPLVVKGHSHALPFEENTFDFVFSGVGRLEKSTKPVDFAAEIQRALKPEGFAVIHISPNDSYSFNSFLGLFESCRFVKSRDIDNPNSSLSRIREILMQKQVETNIHLVDNSNSGEHSQKKCYLTGAKLEIVHNAEPLIAEEPLKPWLTLRKNLKNIRYLPSLVDISFKSRYVYVDVGARGYGSSIGSWFKKQYPKQNKTFDIYAIEADKSFYEEYKSKKRIQLLPYAAWIRNETLSFEINHDPGNIVTDPKTRGMGRIQPKTKKSKSNQVNEIQGFDFAIWVKNTVKKRDYVVMKMDIEGTEFDLIPRLIETGAICLIDEMFIECHYNRWQRCCPGKRSEKYEKSYNQCLDLFNSLRKIGVLVHQWW